MYIRIGFDIAFNLPAPAPMLLMLYTHPSRARDIVRPEVLKVEPNIPVERFTDSFGNRCGRIVAPAGLLRLTSDGVVQDSGKTDEVNWNAKQVPVEQLPPETLKFLLASRYCEVDRLSEIAWSLFGGITPGWIRAQAVMNWVHGNVTFGYQYARPTKTAFDVYTERQGVCRDFTHLSITLLRCMGIPARYATGYLGDIGVPISPAPMDFSAWLEVYLDGRWYTFDARHNRQRIGRIVMARGRDAADAALTTSFGQTQLVKFTVVTDEITQDQIAAVAPPLSPLSPLVPTALA
jgi:transglutaminase-like putative cysteine protease